MRYKIIKQHDGTHQLLRDGNVLCRTVNTEKVRVGQPTQIELEFWSEIERLRSELAIQQEEGERHDYLG